MDRQSAKTEQSSRQIPKASVKFSNEILLSFLFLTSSSTGFLKFSSIQYFHRHPGSLMLTIFILIESVTITKVMQISASRTYTQNTFTVRIQRILTEKFQKIQMILLTYLLHTQEEYISQDDSDCFSCFCHKCFATFLHEFPGKSCYFCFLFFYFPILEFSVTR